jgi:hypothetical protein
VGEGLAEPDEDPFRPVAIGARGLVLAVLAYWTWGMAAAGMGAYSLGLVDMTNLVFHEAGHILFLPLGSFMTSLGGSLTQFLIPLVCMATFVVKNRDLYAAAVALWWAGENLVDIAPYVADARALQLILLGGHTGAEVEGHDWEAILGALGWLPYDVGLGRACHRIGVLVMLAAIAWGAWVLGEQYRGLRTAKSPA